MNEFREDPGTFACPICGQSTPHGHRNEGIGMIRWYEERHPHRFIAGIKERGILPSYLSDTWHHADADGVFFIDPEIQKHWVTYQSAIRDERRTGEG